MWQAVNESMGIFCASVFWDTDLTWNSSDPKFTLCFERTVLVWLPCAFLWFFSPLSIYLLRRGKTRATIPFNWYNVCKLILIGILVTSSLTDIVINVFLDRSHVFVDTYTPFVKFFTICLFFGLTYANIKCGTVSSVTLFTFSVLLAFCGASQFRNELRSRSNIFGGVDWTEGTSKEIMEFLSYFIYYLTVLLISFLNCFADARSAVEIYHTQNVCPENYSSVLSKMCFAWFDSLAWRSYKHTLKDDDVWVVETKLSTASISSRFESNLNRAFKLHKTVQIPDDENGKLLERKITDEKFSARLMNSAKPVSVFRPLCQTFGSEFIIGSLGKLSQALHQFVGSFILSSMLTFVGNREEPAWHGYLYAILLFVATIIQLISITLYGRTAYRVGIQMRTALISVIYKKALKISNGARRKFTTGEIVNLVSVDAERFTRIIYFIPFIWSVPLEIGFTLYYLWKILGASVFAGVAVLILTVSINCIIGSKIQKKQAQLMKPRDKRVELMTEILSGIKVLKLNAWEPSFEKQVARLRRKEIAILRKTSYLKSFSSFVFAVAPFLMSFVIFAIYVLSSENNVLTAQVAFVSLSLFNILRYILLMIPVITTNLTEAAVSIKRINKFLNAEEVDPFAVRHEERPEPVIIENGYFSWESQTEQPVLSNINLRVSRGSLVAVIGAVGSGKTSLLSAILGEMYKQSGIVNTTGTLAYVPQQAWIRNATFKDNITLGSEPKDSFYENILVACALNADLKTFPGRDRAEIGEKGINLSGGQKQRVSLARAVFLDSNTYLLDDPLSAVDSHVGKHIFEEVIGPNGLLKNKTRIWVTHNLSYLSQVDCIILLQNGVISESGTYNELLESNGDFAKNLATYMKGSSDKGEDVVRTVSQPENTEESEICQGKNVEVAEEKLIDVEKGAIGAVGWGVYTYYLKAMGLTLVVAILLMNIVYQIFSVASNYWLSVWSGDDAVSKNGDDWMQRQYIYLGVYALFGFADAFSVMIQTNTVYRSMFKAANYVHNSLLTSVLHWPTITFDRIPSGRIINRFSCDMDVLDNLLPQTLANLLTHTAGIMSTLVVISYSLPMFIYVILPIGATYFIIQRLCTRTSRQLKRLMSISKSPIFSHVGETFTGAQLIRAHGMQSKFISMLQKKIDLNQRSNYANVIVDRWLSVRLGFLGAMIVLFSAIFSVYARDTLSAGIVGLSISYAMQISLKLFGWLYMMSEVQSNMVAIERIKEYTDDIEQEALCTLPEENLSSDWPNNGEVVLEDLTVRYRDGLESVLKGISFSIKKGEKVGIVGRTGAGKSTLVSSLFRIIEPAGGRILIDGVDVSKIGLHTLRGRLTIIPQDPILFSGTLRSNLDPTDSYLDKSLWRALELANLKTFVSSLNFGLQSEVTEGGSNLSVGQRQLICLARAILRKTKVLILDEATASVDLENDDLIQNTIRKEFKDSTVLTIAHRLNTVLDYDRIIVLDGGQVIEFDSPDALLKSKQSLFNRMASAAGLT